MPLRDAEQRGAHQRHGGVKKPARRQISKDDDQKPAGHRHQSQRDDAAAEEHEQRRNQVSMESWHPAILIPEDGPRAIDNLRGEVRGEDFVVLCAGRDSAQVVHPQRQRDQQDECKQPEFGATSHEGL